MLEIGTESSDDSSIEQNPSFMFPGPGEYEVSLTVNPDSLCNHSITLPVVVGEPLDINALELSAACYEGDWQNVFEVEGELPEDATFTWIVESSSIDTLIFTDLFLDLQL